jgi:hypothetical protein
MKELTQTLLIGGGIIGLLPSLPIAGYLWMMHRAWGGDITIRERLTVWSPLFCVAAIVIGVSSRRIGKKEPNPESSVSAEPETGLLLNKPGNK